jgi:8-oxo-dGTP diphosphatase
MTQYDADQYDADQYDAEVAIAILYQGPAQNRQFLLQLRDDIPTIVYPGHWAFCGGHLDPGEDADTAVVRELQEEIGHVPAELLLFRRAIGPTQDGRQILRNFYYGELTVPVSTLALNEGQELGLTTIADIERGYRFSDKNQEDRPMPPQHREMLLAFIAEHRP